jgi:hypothetical protein
VPAQVEAAQPAVAPSTTSAPASDATEGDSIGLTVIRPVADFRSVLLTRGSGPSRSGGRPPLPREADSPTTSAQGGPDVVSVEGRLCPDGHFNDPDSSTCAACSAPIDRGGERVSQPRPPLGCLITDDGRVYTVAGDYVIGREPGQAPAVKSGKAQPLVLQDAEHSTSRIHAHVRVSGWKTLVSDGGSSNGTFISRSGPAGPWTAVPQEPGTVLSAGDRVRLGKRQLLFDRYRESHAL